MTKAPLKLLLIAMACAVAGVVSYVLNHKGRELSIYRVSLTGDQLDREFLTSFEPPKRHDLPYVSPQLPFPAWLQTGTTPAKVENLIFHSVASKATADKLRDLSAITKCEPGEVPFSCSAQPVDPHTHDLVIMYLNEQQSVWLWDGQGALIGVRTSNPEHPITFYLIIRAMS